MIHVSCLYAYDIYIIHMLFVHIFYIVMNTFDIIISMINYLLYVIIIMIIYEIKMIWKLAIFLTLKTPIRTREYNRHRRLRPSRLYSISF
jgi:membrane-bound acyltransferase YfiQ involved in biofilm formation